MDEKFRISSEIIDQDFADFKYTKEDFENSPIKIRGSIRAGMGLVYDADEWEKKRARVLNKKKH